MIIYGSRMYFKKNLVRAYGVCEHCGVYGQQNSYQARKFGHIYFIPLIPLGGIKQVMCECASCSMGSHIPMEKLDPMVDALAQKFKSWGLALSHGQTEIATEDDGKPTSIGLLIAGILEDLYCLKEIESVDAIVSLLESNQMNFEKEVVKGQWATIQGDLDEAKARLYAAHRLRPSDPMPLYQMGLVAIRSGDTAAAEKCFGKYGELVPEDISPHIELAGVYEVQRDHAKLITTYDQIYDRNPDVINDRGMKKIYKKACKKTKMQGRYLAQM